MNQTAVPRAPKSGQIDDYSITSELAEARVWYVEGDALARFAQMTNWDYYEASLRFQKVLDAAGMLM